MRILIVDDTQLNITLLQYLIKKIPEYESVSFTDPHEALEWCRDNEPDLVVVDYMMPEMDGIMFTQQFRGFENYKDIPVLLVTANNETTVRHKALISGVTDFLNKPLDNSEFVARARNMLALRQCHKTMMDQSAWLADEVYKATTQVVEQEHETIFCLAKAAEFSDPETGAHILRMAHYSQIIARALNLPIDQQDLLFKAAPMHDIGKVGIAKNILLKPGKLTHDEFTIMKQHATIGYELLSSNNSPLLNVAAEIAYTHHEKFDGSGYPRGLAGNHIPLFGRIVAVADVFDALTSERPHKRAWGIKKASDFLRQGAGKHFDPTCIEAFFSDFDEVIRIKLTFSDETVEEENLAW
ncbi:cyclic di-GMP phosphodiesterase response regulator RpfG [mine drainage metagenome]|uniref:Cyclic di-GMP phosphodiesterase response regulator RpfG n=1 Tax=mine drainage metagenome TaxID=410659 RepID=A0A1J5RGK5_9ZZZZ